MDITLNKDKKVRKDSETFDIKSESQNQIISNHDAQRRYGESTGESTRHPRLFRHPEIAPRGAAMCRSGQLIV